MRPRTKDHDLPKGVYKKRGVYYFVRRNVWHRLGTEVDQKRIADLQRQESGRADLEAHIRGRLYQQKQEAKKRGREFSVTPDEVVAVLERQEWKCALTGMHFSLDARDGMRIKPYAPSVDRVSNDKGYTAGNIRVVLAAVNIARNAMDDDLLLLIAGSLRRQRLRSFRQDTP